MCFFNLQAFAQLAIGTEVRKLYRGGNTELGVTNKTWKLQCSLSTRNLPKNIFMKMIEALKEEMKNSLKEIEEKTKNPLKKVKKKSSEIGSRLEN